MAWPYSVYLGIVVKTAKYEGACNVTTSFVTVRAGDREQALYLLHNRFKETPYEEYSIELAESINYNE